MRTITDSREGGNGSNPPCFEANGTRNRRPAARRLIPARPRRGRIADAEWARWHVVFARQKRNAALAALHEIEKECAFDCAFLPLLGRAERALGDITDQVEFVAGMVPRPRR